MEKISSALAVSANQLGYSELRENQRLVVSNFMLGNDVFVSLPTGSGKSLCYWVLPKAFDVLNQTRGPVTGHTTHEEKLLASYPARDSRFDCIPG